MTYKELYEKAAAMLDRGEITLGDFNKMVKPLDVEIHPEPPWIPVTERLPEEEGEYLVTSVYQYYRDGRKTYKTTVDRWSRNGAGKEWVATSNDAHIAWMPLPEPYKGVTT